VICVLYNRDDLRRPSMYLSIASFSNAIFFHVAVDTVSTETVRRMLPLR